MTSAVHIPRPTLEPADMSREQLVAAAAVLECVVRCGTLAAGQAVRLAAEVNLEILDRHEREGGERR